MNWSLFWGVGLVVLWDRLPHVRFVTMESLVDRQRPLFVYRAAREAWTGYTKAKNKLRAHV
jgi:hypothetical protein